MIRAKNYKNVASFFRRRVYKKWSALDVCSLTGQIYVPLTYQMA